MGMMQRQVVVLGINPNGVRRVRDVFVPIVPKPTDSSKSTVVGRRAMLKKRKSLPPKKIIDDVIIVSSRRQSMSPAFIDRKKHGNVRRYLKADELIGHERRKCQHKPDFRHADIYR